ncbi:hypothetical protein CHELA20_54373 [Hyphomicrobiales bacterium]|nr:hypothetical protein CHELA41_20555 [Hyphomicrobiales bacterium]CAH1686134.1 hypothetical protein CHELA20_54373 [Hyphomicrobiales bacterium]
MIRWTYLRSLSPEGEGEGEGYNRGYGPLPDATRPTSPRRGKAENGAAALRFQTIGSDHALPHRPRD